MSHHEDDPVDDPHHHQAGLLHRVVHQQIIPSIVVFQASPLETPVCLHPFQHY